MMRILLFTLALGTLLIPALSLAQTDSSSSDTLYVDIVDLDFRRGGWLHVSLFGSEDSWMKKGERITGVKVSPGNSTNLRIPLPGITLIEGMAIIVLHDENDNGKLDFQWLPPKPLEGVGNSNNHRRMGPPLYERAVIDPLKFSGSVTIEMVY